MNLGVSFLVYTRITSVRFIMLFWGDWGVISRILGNLG